jgi:hypothetical protein
MGFNRRHSRYSGCFFACGLLAAKFHAADIESRSQSETAVGWGDTGGCDRKAYLGGPTRLVTVRQQRPEYPV